MIELTTQFTIKEELEQTLPFLDTWTTHHNNRILSTTVFQKNHTDWYLDVEPDHLLAHKVSVAHTMFTWANKICMDNPDKAKAKEHVAGALRMNGNPRRLVIKDWEPSACPANLKSQTHPKWSYHTSSTCRRQYGGF